MRDRERVRAAAAGQPAWGTEGSAIRDIRYAEAAPQLRHRCRLCDCGQRATHCGMANGLALCSGCELSVRRWVKFGYDPTHGAS